MEIEITVWLRDVLRSITEIESYFTDRPKLFEEYIKDTRTKRAVERNLEIIGEAINRILKKDSTITISHVRKIVDMRNRIIHAYDAVSDDIVWSIVINHLPLLKTEIEHLLEENKE